MYPHIYIWPSQPAIQSSIDRHDEYLTAGVPEDTIVWNRILTTANTVTWISPGNEEEDACDQEREQGETYAF